MSVVSIADYRTHLGSTARCMTCSHEWEAVAPIGTQWLECPECKGHKGFFKLPALRSGDEWQCGCGNNLFLMMRDGIYCPNCGDWQKGF